MRVIDFAAGKSLRIEAKHVTDMGGGGLPVTLITVW